MATFSNDIFTIEYDKDDKKEKTRTVGLELEVKVTDRLSPFHKDNRYERDKDGWLNSIPAEKVLKQSKELEGIIAGAGQDGTDLEFVTHPDSITLYNKGGSERLKKAMKFLKKHTKGGKDAPNSGTHVNIGFYEGEDTEHTMDNAYWLVMNYATQLQKLAGRVTHWARFINYSNINTFHMDSDIDMLNIVHTKKPDAQRSAPKNHIKEQCLVLKKHTFEFRIFKSTTELQEVLAWVQLCYNLIELASGGKELKDITFKDLVKGKYISKYTASLKGNRSISAEEMQATLQNTLSFRLYDTNGTIIL